MKYKYLVAFYLRIIVASLAFFVANNCSGTESNMEEASPMQEIDLSIDRARDRQRQIDNSVPERATIFIGDSIIQRLKVSSIVSNGVNFGIGWQRSDQLIKSVDLYKSITRASRVVIMIGTNDFMQGRESEIGRRYEQLLEKIPANIDIIFSSPPPIGDISVFGKKLDGSNMRYLSDAAKKACLTHANCRFVNTYELLLTNGKPTPGVLLSDQVHLSMSGYELLENVLRDLIVK